MERNPKTYPAPAFGVETLAEPGSAHDLMLKFVGRDKRVLEFGCASGSMSRMLSLSGCRVTGVELNPAAAAEARHFCQEVIVADLDSRSLDDILPETTFEAAVFGDVLEHLRDPQRVLDDTRPFIAAGGFVVLSIPNIAHGSVRLSLLAGKFDYKDAGLLDDSHVRFFTLSNVVDLCLRAGYRIESIERTRMPIFSQSPYLPNVDARDYDPATVERVSADPEAETFQFIVKAFPLDDAAKREAIYAELARVRDELEQLRRATGAERSDVRFASARAEIESARAQIDEQRAEIERLREESARVLGERSALEAAHEDAKHLLASNVSELRAHFDVELARAAARIEELEAARVEAAVERAEMSIELADREFERDVAVDERNRAEGAIASARAEAGSLHEKLQMVTAALNASEAEAASRYDDLQAQLRHTRSEFERQTREYAEYRTEADRIAAAFAELGVLHRSLSEVDANRIAAIEVHEAAIAARDETIAALRDALAEATSDLERERRKRAAAHAIFAEYLDYEIANATHQAAVVDGMIARYHASKWWSLKRLVGKVRRKRG